MEHKGKSRQIWWTEEIEKLVGRSISRWLDTKNQNDKDTYNHTKRQVTSALIKEKNKIWENMCLEIITYNTTVTN